jgi:hypothetical protein
VKSDVESILYECVVAKVNVAIGWHSRLYYHMLHIFKVISFGFAAFEA